VIPAVSLAAGLLASEGTGKATVIRLAVTVDDVRRAALRIAADVLRTPATESRTLSALTGVDVVVKFENLQFTASFKDRGAANKLRLLSADERDRGVLAVSAGNHAQSVAYHATRMGISSTIVMPASAPFTKAANAEALGAEVLQVGATFADALEAARRLEGERGLIMVHPYDDPDVIAGQGTLAIELLDDIEGIDTVLVPVGGGGLLAGVATYARAVCPGIELVGVQSGVYPSMTEALAGREAAAPRAATLADGIAVKEPGRLTLPIVRDLVDQVITVPERAIERAVSLYIEIEKTVAEGAGAVGLAALLEQPDRWRGKRVALVLSGGNIDSRVLASVLMRELVHSGRITALRIALPDLPGQLAPVVAVIAASGANIVEIDHRRLFDPISPRATNVDVVMETRDRLHTATGPASRSRFSTAEVVGVAAWSQLPGPASVRRFGSRRVLGRTVAPWIDCASGPSWPPITPWASRPCFCSGVILLWPNSSMSWATTNSGLGSIIRRVGRRLARPSSCWRRPVSAPTTSASAPG
jgi:threonine dehydratase